MHLLHPEFALLQNPHLDPGILELVCHCLILADPLSELTPDLLHIVSVLRYYSVFHVFVHLVNLFCLL